MFSELDLILRYPFKSKNPVLIDVGAHHGFFSKPFAERGWRVIAFEPEDSNLKAFQANLRGFKNVNLFKEAVSDVSCQKVPFYTSDKYYGIHSLKSFDKSHHYAYDVLTTRLDQKLQRLGVLSVDLLKIDIEGADFLALKSFDFDEYSPKLVMVEFMDSRSLPNFGYGYKDMIGYMKIRGYEVFVSQWDKIKEYGRENVPTEPHEWLGCVLYQDLVGESFWGNLIFLKKENIDNFKEILRGYIESIGRPVRVNFLKKYGAGLAKKILPSRLFNLLKGSVEKILS